MTAAYTGFPVDLLINHKDECYGINDRATKIQMPAPGEKIKFKNYHKQMQVPFVIYADFESIIKPYQAAAGDKSEIKSKHQACGFGYQIVRYDGASSNVRIYRGEDAGEQFLKSLHQEVININAIFAKPKPLHMSEKNEKDFQSATQCWICQKEFNDEKNPKVRDHCHILGQYRGPAHKICNVKLAIKPWITPIPVVFHNLKGYDSHLIMQQIHKITGRLSCIPNNTEKYISFSVGQLKFLDSFQFIGSSLAKLVDATDKDDFKITQNSFNPHPIKKRLYGSMGSENSRPIILRESIDKQKLAYILKHPSQFEFGTDFRNGQNQLGLLKTYFSMLNQNGERLMPYKQRNGFGRYWTAQTFGIQNMSRRIRHTICRDSMVDIDIKNAHPTLLSWYCHKHGIKCEALDKYIKSREPMLQDLVNCRHITRDEAKKFLLAIMNGKQINLQPGDLPWLIGYYAGMRNIIRAVVQLNPELYDLAKQSKYNHYNLEGSTINHLLCGLENKALMAAFDYLNGKGIEVAVLVFDGLMIYKNDVTNIAGILQGCSSSVNQVLEGCDIEFTVKEMDEGYDIPSTTRPTNQPVDINLLLQKGVYPYEYMDSFDRFQETELPPIGKFYSSLSDESISKNDYQHAQEVWKTFNCENLGDYHDLYLKTDVTLLADVFQTFRRTCMNAYKLDPLNYYTAPGLSWDALLKYTAIELELLTDYDQHLFIEKGMRGGISMASKRHAKANNPGVPGYDPSEEHNHIMYYDANNLYGWAMSQPLPYSGFKWVDKPPTEPGKGCILEVDLEYPAELHESHNDYPLAPERFKVKKEWLSGYQANLLEDDNILNTEKLVPNLMDKTKYVLHYRNLQLYLSLGMKLKKIHRILEFNEAPWMEPYIRMNTEFSKKSKSAFEKDFYKLMNNSVFGKTMENLRKRVDIKVVRTCGYPKEKEQLRKIIAKPNYDRAVIFSEELLALHSHKTRLKLNKPVYVGMCVLDLSKHLMYDWYYNTLKRKYGSQCTLLYTDTDRLLVDITNPDVYADMESMKTHYDFSDYPKDHQLFSEENKNPIGSKFKDECSGTPIAEYVGLRPKMYSILRADEQLIKKAKGVKKYVITKQINFANYKDALFNQKTYSHEMNMLRSQKHQIYGLTINKTTLSPLDTKRWTAPDGITTYAFGYRQEQ